MKTSKSSIKNVITSKNRAYSIIRTVSSYPFVALRLNEIATYDSYTYGHCVNVAIEAVQVGIYLNLSEFELGELACAALLHDYGKIFISSDIIQKNGALTDEEYKIIQQHPFYAYQVLKKSDLFSEPILQGILYHHENLDGTGYYKIRGEKINLYARIIRIVDTYDAMLDKRSYRDGLPLSLIFTTLFANVNTFYDKRVVHILYKIVESIGKLQN